MKSRLFRYFPHLTCVLAWTLAASSSPVLGKPDVSTSDPLAPPAFDERWYVVMMEDPQSGQFAQCGYMHAITKTVEDQVQSQMKIKFEIRRGTVSVQMTQEQNFVETPEGAPLSFRFVSAIGKDPETLNGTVKDGRVLLVAEQYGREKDRNWYDFDPAIRFPWGQALEQRRHGLAPGTKYTLKSYEPALQKDGALEMHCEVMKREKKEVLGKELELTRIRSILNIGDVSEDGAAAALSNAQIESDVWVSDDFNPAIMTMNMGIMKMKMFETTKEEAMKRGAPPEMFFETFVHTNRTIGKDAKLVELRLRLKKDAPGSVPNLPDTEMQDVERKTARESTVSIARNDWKKARSVKSPAEYPDAVQPMLNASTLCDSKDAKIRRLSKRTVRGKSTPAEKADALRKFASEYITDKNLDVGFATASDVVRNRSGDCSEHAVFLAALCRAAGIPARGVSGIVEVPAPYLERGKSAFGYHMWTQVYIGDEWLDIDAALQQTDCEPNRVALSIMPLGDEGLASAVASLIPLLGRLEIDVVEVKK